MIIDNPTLRAPFAMIESSATSSSSSSGRAEQQGEDMPVVNPLNINKLPWVLLQHTMTFLQGDEAARDKRVCTYWRGSINRDLSVWKAQAKHLGIPVVPSLKRAYEHGFSFVRRVAYGPDKWKRDLVGRGFKNPAPFPKNI